MATKPVIVSVAGAPEDQPTWSVTAPGFIAFDSATSEIAIEDAPTFSETPTAVTARLGLFTFTDAEEFDQGVEVTDETGFGWESFTIVEGHDIITTPRVAPNTWTAWAVEWTATKTGGYPPLVSYSNVVYVERFARTGGEIVVTGGSRPLLAGETIDVDVSSLTFSVTPDATTTTVSAVMPDGSRVAIPPDSGAPTPATISHVGSVAVKVNTLTIPTHQAADTAVGVFMGTGLAANKAAMDAAGWTIEASSEVDFNGYDAFVAHRYLDGPGTAFPSTPNLQRAIVSVYRGLSPTSPIAGLATSLITNGAATDIVLPALAGLPAGSHIMRFRSVNNRTGTMPADATLTERAEVNKTVGQFYACVSADSNGVATSIAEATVAMGFASRTLSYTIGLRPGVAA